LFGGNVADTLGRRGGILVTMPICAMAWLLTAFSHDFASLIIGRVLSGVGVGAVSMLVPIYIAETAPTRLRGALGACNQLAVTFGIFAVYVLGGSVFRVKGDDGDFCQWRYLAFSVLAPVVVLFALAFAIPESPMWHMNRGQMDRAERSLQRLNRVESGRDMIALVQRQAGVDEQPQPSMFSAAMRRKLWDSKRALTIGVVAMLAQQFSGINAIIFYQAPILKDANITWYNLASIITMLLQVLFTGVSCWLMDRAGRKPLLLFSFVGMTIASFFVGLYFFLQTPGEEAKAVWMLLAGTYVYIACFSIGAGPIPWLLMAEIFPSDIRGTACTIATVVNWTSSFTVTLTVKLLKDTLQYEGLFWLYSGVCFLAVLFVHFMVVETKGKSMEEITAVLKGQPRSLLGQPLSPIEQSPLQSPVQTKA
jgi:SP family facilitated glucose transporter-like MFS transporter 8